MRQFTLAFALALACALAGLMGASLVHAQIGNPAGMAPATPQSEPGQPAPGHHDTRDRLSGHLMAAGAMAEVDAARLSTIPQHLQLLQHLHASTTGAPPPEPAAAGRRRP